ncbi:NAD-dependent SIR2 family protein deacetylase [Paraburkholderia bannensis]|uniref:protein acetyllysine N-acetyltransferase n=1 Tax=Paraburkholderia bannensis TaxID=765414 RepID=A0A7W9TTZ9_9BURK|nr:MULTISPECIES: Sir2 family NAD-dependent protein deacetylase [Paraburkholderia]MBB3256224.1 NAD-dependent SIR2 family protein deacetylase [Paraburkholderia sp. WP4_3_2]MBB6101224.1 NAD-dependent SIR2 family protein deacetylase [Paraburkholderia bannensis]
MDVTQQIEAAAELIRNANGILITDGARMGLDSGLPDFRGDDGFWRAYPALRAEGIGFMDIANGEAFKRDPVRAWGFYGHRLNLYRRTAPYEGFNILRRWASAKEHGAFVFTSNVDGQFQKAGFEANRILECHGSIHRLQCTRPCSHETWSADDFHAEVDEEHCALTSALPRCPKCGSVARPNILMLDDDDWNDYAIRRRRLRFEAWLAGVERMAIVEVGVVRTAPSVHGVPEMTRSQVIRINRPADAIDPKRGINICGGALGILRQLSGFI